MFLATKPGQTLIAACQTGPLPSVSTFGVPVAARCAIRSRLICTAQARRTHAHNKLRLPYCPTRGVHAGRCGNRGTGRAASSVWPLLFHLRGQCRRNSGGGPRVVDDCVDGDGCRVGEALPSVTARVPSGRKSSLPTRRRRMDGVSTYRKTITKSEVNSGKGKDSPAFSDSSTLTAVFPDVVVGDTVVFSYQLVQTEPLFPKHFSIAQSFSIKSRSMISECGSTIPPRCGCSTTPAG